MGENKKMEECQNIMREYTGRCVEILSEKYKFNNREALEYLKLEKKKSKIILPFCGVINKECCEGVKLNYGLYTQCTNKKEKNNLCKQCVKDGEPRYGRIKERLEQGDNYRDIKGKFPIKYGNIMEKFNITKEEAIEEARKYNLTIPDKEFEIYKAKRGRPKKEVAVSDTESECSIKEPKKRGRPKKEKTILSSLAPGDTLIAELVAQAQIKDKVELKEPVKEPVKEPLKEPLKEPVKKEPVKKEPVKKEPVKEPVKKEPVKEPVKKEPVKKEPEPDSDSDSEEEIEVSRFTDPNTGKQYLKDSNNTLYDMITQDEVGHWNSKSNKIEVQ